MNFFEKNRKCYLVVPVDGVEIENDLLPKKKNLHIIRSSHFYELTLKAPPGISTPSSKAFLTFCSSQSVIRLIDFSNFIFFSQINRSLIIPQNLLKCFSSYREITLSKVKLKSDFLIITTTILNRPFGQR